MLLKMTTADFFPRIGIGHGRFSESFPFSPPCAFAFGPLLDGGSTGGNSVWSKKAYLDWLGNLCCGFFLFVVVEGSLGLGCVFLNQTFCCLAWFSGCGSIDN